ncbi:MAG: AAA family ATPase, partial [Candidatus Moraniibacteriota bacterium]
MQEKTIAACLPIKEQDLNRFTTDATALLAKVLWKPKKARLTMNVPGAKQWSEAAEAGIEKELSLMKLAPKFNNDPFLMDEAVLHVLTTVRQGLRIGMHLFWEYYRHSGMENLIALNKRKILSDKQKTEFNEIKETASAVYMFATAYYVVWKLSKYRTEEVSAVNHQIDGIPETDFTLPQIAGTCMVFYYTAYATDLLETIKTKPEVAFVKMTLLYFQAVIEDIKMRLGSLNRKEIFENNHYKLEGTEFNINGFDSQVISSSATVEFNRMELTEIVGNHDAKHHAHRLVERLLCYDFTAKKNPMQELRGFSTVRLGHGIPGTGKSMLIAAIATMLKDRCEQLGYPFLFWPMPENVVSTFQGGSKERMLDWMHPMRDPNRIIYAPADDAENNFEDRTRPGVSAGVREVIGAFLTNTEGATAINHGNSVIELYTNIPEQLDKAVLSRIKVRAIIDGAKTLEDFLDQDYLWWVKYAKMDPKFINMKDPEGYEYKTAQALGPNLLSVCGKYEKP